MEKNKEFRFDSNMGRHDHTNGILWYKREEEKQGFASDVIAVDDQGNDGVIINGAAAAYADDGGFQSSEDSTGITRILLHFQENFTKCNPLGLTLRKTPSLSSLLEMQLSPPQQQAAAAVDNNQASRTRMGNLVSRPKKLKASNFPITSIKIGPWQRISMNEGDLIAKLYYAKKKIVWEILDGPLESTILEGDQLKSNYKLKSKIEIVWSDITAIQAIMGDDDQPAGILNIELDKPPTFFRETNPQAGKHTNWQIINDFTNDQATIWRIHCVSFPPKVLDKHYEKLLQCDQQLFKLSQEPFPSHECPYFQSDMIMNNFNGFGAFAPLVQQYRCPTHYLTVARGLPTPPPPNPVMGFPYINQERAGNHYQQQPPNWGQGMNIFPRGDINSTQIGSSPQSNQLLVFNGNNNYYQPNGDLTLEDIEKHLALEDDEDEANLLAQMHSMDNPNDNVCDLYAVPNLTMETWMR